MFRLNCHYQVADTIWLKCTAISSLIVLVDIRCTNYSYNLQGLKCYEMFIINCYTVVVTSIADSSLIANWLLVLLTSIALWSELYVVVKPVCYVNCSTDNLVSFRLCVSFYY